MRDKSVLQSEANESSISKEAMYHHQNKETPQIETAILKDKVQVSGKSSVAVNASCIAESRHEYGILKQEKDCELDTETRGTKFDLNAEIDSKLVEKHLSYPHKVQQKSRENSDCGSSNGSVKENDSLRCWEEMKRNGFLSIPQGSVPVPKRRERKSKSKSKSKSESVSKILELPKKEEINRFSVTAAPSGLLTGFNPGIITRVRNSKQVYSIIKALVRSEKNENSNKVRRTEGESIRGNKDIESQMTDIENIYVPEACGSGLFLKTELPECSSDAIDYACKRVRSDTSGSSGLKSGPDGHNRDTIKLSPSITKASETASSFDIEDSANQTSGTFLSLKSVNSGPDDHGIDTVKLSLSINMLSETASSVNIEDLANERSRTSLAVEGPDGHDIDTVKLSSSIAMPSETAISLNIKDSANQASSTFLPVKRPDGHDIDTGKLTSTMTMPSKTASSVNVEDLADQTNSTSQAVKGLNSGPDGQDMGTFKLCSSIPMTSEIASSVNSKDSKNQTSISSLSVKGLNSGPDGHDMEAPKLSSPITMTSKIGSYVNSKESANQTSITSLAVKGYQNTSDSQRKRKSYGLSMDSSFPTLSIYGQVNSHLNKTIQLLTRQGVKVTVHNMEPSKAREMATNLNKSKENDAPLKHKKILPVGEKVRVSDKGKAIAISSQASVKVNRDNVSKKNRDNVSKRSLAQRQRRENERLEQKRRRNELYKMRVVNKNCTSLVPEITRAETCPAVQTPLQEG